MNAPERIAFLDVQSQFDSRNIHIDAVGIKGVRYPVTIGARGHPVPTVADLSLTVGLAASAKGTHMSRFIELLEAQTEALDQALFKWRPVVTGAGLLARLVLIRIALMH